MQNCGFIRANGSFRVIDYETDLVAFEKKVEEDALAFRPFGEKIHSYTKPALSSSEVLEYEVWHVSFTPA